MDVVRSEAVEADLDRFIRKRHDRRVLEEGERQALEAWEELERRFDENRRRENRVAWAAFHEDQAERHRRTLEHLIGHHETQAAMLCEERREG